VTFSFSSLLKIIKVGGSSAKIYKYRFRYSPAIAQTDKPAGFYFFSIAWMREIIPFDYDACLHLAGFL
jgi:hypothetical protein